MSIIEKLKKLPRHVSDQEAEDFLETADLSEYDLSDMQRTHFGFTAKDSRVNMRLPASLLTEVKAKAARLRMPYQRYIRQVLDMAVGQSK